MSNINNSESTNDIELIEYDTILGLCKYHLFDNNIEPLTVGLRSSGIGEIHTLTLLNPVGFDVTINSSKDTFILNTINPLIRLIYTSKGFKKIQD